ncbi:hypothetical protein C8R44DRAFT_831717 [Mycena epipterygia]|nr:hypothetical protein C8R44DRAFT_831717 [Mycena epipterygia]
MALPLFWPGRYLFYPIGNTSAVSLTRDLAPETDGTILMLGCGDPRNILYTIFCESEHLDRALDFTCCDMDPAILARNVILLTLVADNQTSPAIIWNIFFHMRLNQASLAVLVSQCRKLIDISATLEQWCSSVYSHFIRMCTEYTLAELRRHWSLYVTMQDLPPQRTSAIEVEFAKRSKYATQQMLTSSRWSVRSAGPLMTRAASACGEHFQAYWNTGGSCTSPDELRGSRLINPTFAYSLGGEGCSVHHETDPMTPFHLASVLANTKKKPTVADVVAAAKTEFVSWCSSFYASVVGSPNQRIPIIRFFVGEATAVCQSLRTYATTGALAAGIPVAKWNTHFIKLDEHEYQGAGAPTIFNIIDTSNLDDHIGCLNVIIAAVPLLPISPRYFVLYTESLLFHDQDATKEFAGSLQTDLSTIAHLVGICPVDYLSGFSSRSNAYDLSVHKALGMEAGQFHRVTTWKSPSSANDLSLAHAGEKCMLPIFNSHQLGTRLYDMYRQLFAKEESSYFIQLDPTSQTRAIATSNLVNEIRETFVLFLKLVRDRLEIPERRWSEAMERFFSLFPQEETWDQLNRHDLYARSHLHGVHTVSFFHFDVPKVGPMADWDRVPSLVRIILTVPRKNLALLKEISEPVGTPLLQCEFSGTSRGTLDVFTSVHAAFGTIIPTGTAARPSVIFSEDPEGRMGTSPLIVSFAVATRLLTVDAVNKILVRLALRGTTGIVHYAQRTNRSRSDFRLFSANLMDQTHVTVLPEQPIPFTKPEHPRPCAAATIPQIGNAGPLMVEMDKECEVVERLICRVSVESEGAKHLFSSGSNPEISQKSTCVMQLSIGNHKQDIAFPFPVIAPISGPFRAGGMKMNPFPIIGENLAFVPWNLHRLNLARLPTIDKKAPDVQGWLKPHLKGMFSVREHQLAKSHENDALALIKNTTRTIFHHVSGISGAPLRRVFRLQDETSSGWDTIIFVSDIKFDLASHTLVCDGYVLSLAPANGEAFRNLQEDDLEMLDVPIYGDEIRAWKQLLPAFAERCRSWKHKSDCEYAVHRTIPLSVEMHSDPLCSCGRGENVGGMTEVEAWSKFASLVTRIALSPLFAWRAGVCRGKGKPKMNVCQRCLKAPYCSKECQRKDWGTHKPKCNPV